MMRNQGNVIRVPSFSIVVVGMLVALFAEIATAQVTVKRLRVTVSPAAGATVGAVTAMYCDTGTPCPGGIQVWESASGVPLLPGQTLVLTQTQGIRYKVGIPYFFPARQLQRKFVDKNSNSERIQPYSPHLVERDSGGNAS